MASPSSESFWQFLRKIQPQQHFRQLRGWGFTDSSSSLSCNFPFLTFLTNKSYDNDNVSEYSWLNLSCYEPWSWKYPRGVKLVAISVFSCPIINLSVHQVYTTPFWGLDEETWDVGGQHHCPQYFMLFYIYRWKSQKLTDNISRYRQIS